MKTHKSIAKRFKVTRTGKVLKQKAGKDHFNSRESGTVTRMKRRDVSMSESFTRTIKRLTSKGA